jgi:hypothetical protein
MNSRPRIDLELWIDGEPTLSETTCTWAGARVLTIHTVVPRGDLALELHSTFVGHPGVPTHVVHLRLGPRGCEASIAAAEVSDPQVEPTYAAWAYAYEHAQRLVEVLTALGHGVTLVTGSLSPVVAAWVPARRNTCSVRSCRRRRRAGSCGIRCRRRAGETSTRWRSPRRESPSRSRRRPGRTTCAISLACASRRPGHEVWRAVDPVASRDSGRGRDRPRCRRASSRCAGAAVATTTRRLSVDPGSTFTNGRLSRRGAARAAGQRGPRHDCEGSDASAPPHSAPASARGRIRFVRRRHRPPRS